MRPAHFLLVGYFAACALASAPTPLAQFLCLTFTLTFLLTAIFGSLAEMIIVDLREEKRFHCEFRLRALMWGKRSSSCVNALLQSADSSVAVRSRSEVYG